MKCVESLRHRQQDGRQPHRPGCCRAGREGSSGRRPERVRGAGPAAPRSCASGGRRRKDVEEPQHVLRPGRPERLDLGTEVLLVRARRRTRCTARPAAPNRSERPAAAARPRRATASGGPPSRCAGRALRRGERGSRSIWHASSPRCRELVAHRRTRRQHGGGGTSRRRCGIARRRRRPHRLGRGRLRRHGAKRQLRAVSRRPSNSSVLVHAAVVERPGARHRHPPRAPVASTRRASAPSPTSGRPTAPPSSTSTAAARSPGTVRASSSATRSSGSPNPIDVVGYVRRLEGMLIDVLAEFGVDRRTRRGPSRRLDPRRQRDEKIAAIGIRVADGVTMHGFALNCSNSLRRVRRDRRLRHPRRRRSRRISRELGRDVTPADVAPRSSASSRLDEPAGRSARRMRRSSTRRAGGRKLLRLEVRNAETPIERKPEWIKTAREDGPGVHRPAEPRRRARSCTPCARRPAARTSTSAGRTARRPSSSAAASAPGAATSARSTPASPPTTTPTSRAASPSRSRG